MTSARNGVPMIESSGFGIAIGNASYKVKGRASAATDWYNKEGLAKAVKHFPVRILALEELTP